MAKSERWQQVEQLYHAALECPAEQRPAFLAEACGADEVLRREVESLLAYEDRAENFIETPALDVAAKMMAQEQGVTVPAGQSINQYKIISPLGAGGMGEVYLAEDTRLARRVALKFLPAHLTRDKRYLRRFEQEARAVAALSHPHVCMIHEVVATGEGRHCIVMEYVEGTTLREHIAEKPMSVNEALDVVIQVASALSAAHAAGVVHRDIKLENIMLRRDGYVKILDFGLAKLTEPELAAEPEAATKMLLNTAPGMVMGTVYYMSPEQARGLPVDARTDIWSLGVVLYELVSGHQPFTGATPTDVIISIAEREPLPLTRYLSDTPTELERIVKKALAKDRERRYQNANDLLIDLKNLKRELEFHTKTERSGQPVSSNNSAANTRPQPIITTRLLPFTFNRSRAILFTATVCLLLIAGYAFFRYFRLTPTSEPPVQIRSLAVLPMANLSGDPDQDYFADGMTDTLIAGLAKIGALRVISSRTTIMQYKGTHKSLPEIARELNVDAIVEGSVQRAGERVKVTVSLISAAEQHLWSDSYDRELRDVLTLQNDVARDVTQNIQIKLTPNEQE
ncbi:MAG TPA: serine/threonine-protein kinase, partial [Pyrinomonadaceae bacterium]|nr:serine/threonine-protein kinase [Pyrinomonadaceae bacterium]